MSEPKFLPKPGQVDYTEIRFAPALNVVVTRGGKVLLAKRSADRRLYPGLWATVDGFLDDNKSIEEKTYEELAEEVGIRAADVASLERGRPHIHEDEAIGKTWLVVPVLAYVTTDRFTLDWEASEARWIDPETIAALNLAPSTLQSISQFFPGIG